MRLLALTLLLPAALLLLVGVRTTLWIYGLSSVIGGVMMAYVDWQWRKS